MTSSTLSTSHSHCLNGFSLLWMIRQTSLRWGERELKSDCLMFRAQALRTALSRALLWLPGSRPGSRRQPLPPLIIRRRPMTTKDAKGFSLLPRRSPFNLLLASLYASCACHSFSVNGALDGVETR